MAGRGHGRLGLVEGARALHLIVARADHELQAVGEACARKLFHGPHAVLARPGRCDLEHGRRGFGVLFVELDGRLDKCVVLVLDLGVLFVVLFLGVFVVLILGVFVVLFLVLALAVVRRLFCRALRLGQLACLRIDGLIAELGAELGRGNVRVVDKLRVVLVDVVVPLQIIVVKRADPVVSASRLHLLDAFDYSGHGGECPIKERRKAGYSGPWAWASGKKRADAKKPAIYVWFPATKRQLFPLAQRWGARAGRAAPYFPPCSGQLHTLCAETIRLCLRPVDDVRQVLEKRRAAWDILEVVVVC